MIRFVEGTHQYFDGDVELPSVTDIIRFCSYDKANNARGGANPFYRERGTRVHELCLELDIDGVENVRIGTGYDGYARAYAAFLRDYRINDWLLMETPLWSAESGFAGTPDRVGYIDGTLTIVDFKTASTLDKPAIDAQLTAYDALVRKKLNTNEPINRVGLQLKKDGAYRIYNSELDPKLLAACCILYNRYGKGKKN